MAIKWTADQQKVISLRDRNLLVSAAAGSGKTAVLVSRIISKVTDPIHPLDIDRLLVMTFTRAAAGEMKERLTKALEKELYENPENEHLLRQMNLIHKAQITTIDGFCSYVLRNYFHQVNLDPAFRIADEGELRLLREDVMEELLEECYEEGDPDYLYFVECFATGKQDDVIGELVQQVYDASMSNPYPGKWLEKCRGMYLSRTEEEFLETPWFSLLWRAVDADLNDVRELLEEALDLCRKPGGPLFYEEAVTADLEQLIHLRGLASDKEYTALSQAFAGIAFPRFSSRKSAGEDPDLRKLAADKRKEAKKILEEIRDSYFAGELTETFSQVKKNGRAIGQLVTLTERFAKRFEEAKREKNILDFADMEHLALSILQNEEGEKTAAARELSAYYDEILIDEYQDSNLVQEYIARAVSGWADSRKNLFMVGDVKQSIYRFRLARPELFMEKYHSYKMENAEEQRIDLHQNFRSRQEVLDVVNYIFGQVMHEDLGGVEYDQAAALYPGAAFPPYPENSGMDSASFPVTEVLLIDKESEELAEETQSGSAAEVEALAVAQRIRQMAGHDLILDPESREYRPVRYGDIVVLFRSAADYSQVFSDVFSARGIPNYKVSRTGYFSALEVVTVLNYLRICSNPRQDIPLASVLHSPIVGCSAQELAMLRMVSPKGLLFDCVCDYARLAGEDKPDHEALKEKIIRFLSQLEDFRYRAQYTPIHQLLLQILDETGYGRYAGVLPDGAQRSANLTMLVEKARDYEKTSYRGLFSFVRYIEKLQKYDMDYGEVNLAADSRDCVQIMTIHKSKGLEYPVVFVCGMGKKFNTRDLTASILSHPEYGLGMDDIDPLLRVKSPGFVKRLLLRQIKLENLGEELRILYVALTRAKEKLIMTGSLGKLEKRAGELADLGNCSSRCLPFRVRYKASCGWDFVLSALARHRGLKDWLESMGQSPVHVLELYEDKAKISFHVVEPEEMAARDVVELAEKESFLDELAALDPGQVTDLRIRSGLESRFDYRYPYSYLEQLPVKCSVSELKKTGWHSEEEAVSLIPVEEIKTDEELESPALVPAFLKKEETQLRGAGRGTAYHRFFECLDYRKGDSIQELKEELDSLVQSNKMSPVQAENICIKDFSRFLASGLGKRMRKAALAGNLYREQPFVFSLPAREANPSWNYDDLILIQGMVDAWFLEDGEIVIVDYKTDAVAKGQEQMLIERYQTQVRQYALALGRLTGKKVKEVCLYSVRLGKELAVAF